MQQNENKEDAFKSEELSASPQSKVRLIEIHADCCFLKVVLPFLTPVCTPSLFFNDTICKDQSKTRSQKTPENIGGKKVDQVPQCIAKEEVSNCTIIIKLF